MLRFLLANALGGAIGYERERAGKTAGIRTHILVGGGSALFTLASIYGFGDGMADISRVAAGVVIGVGFIGGGVILRGAREDEVVGLTTAATVWVTAAVGLCAGVGMYLLSIVATAVFLGVLMLARLRGHDSQH